VQEVIRRMRALVPLQNPLLVLSTADPTAYDGLVQLYNLGHLPPEYADFLVTIAQHRREDGTLDLAAINYGGAFFPGSPSLNVMLINNDFPPEFQLTIAAHEYAHAVFQQAYGGNKARILAEFRASKTGQEFEQTYKAAYDEAYGSLPGYEGFPDKILEEWFADQLAAYALSPQRDPVGFNKFLHDFVDLLRKLYDLLSSEPSGLMRARRDDTDAFAEFIEQAIPAGVFTAPINDEELRAHFLAQQVAGGAEPAASVRNMSTNTGQLGEDIPAYIAESETAVDAVKKARDSVRELLTKLNFKFEETPDLSLSDLERIASKYLTGLHNDDPAFLDDAAKALSYALYTDINENVDVNIPRPVVEKALRSWLEDGKPPKIDRTIWTTIVQ
jgi:hypothetical protein